MNLKHRIIKGLVAGSLMAWGAFMATAETIKVDDTIYANLSKQYQIEVEQARVREQLADLQQRTAAAEARALRAERAAEEAYWSRPTVTYVSSPWIQSYPRYCPHTPTSRKMSPTNLFKSGNSTNSPRVTISVKSDTNIKQ
ncbi:MAG: hypothetical protein WCI03_02750 [bacterium]